MTNEHTYIDIRSARPDEDGWTSAPARLRRCHATDPVSPRRPAVGGPPLSWRLRH